MADLKRLFNDLGYESVQTYIQSGNVIFDSTSDRDNSDIADQIEKSIADKYGFKVPVIVVTVNQLKDAIASNPFFNSDISDVDRLHLTFLKRIPEKHKLIELQTHNFHPDNYSIEKGIVFIYCSGKYSESKLTNKFFENKLKVASTTRNWKTVLKLSELSDSCK